MWIGKKKQGIKCKLEFSYELKDQRILNQIFSIC